MHGLLIRDRKELTEKERAEDMLAGQSAMNKLSELIARKKSRDFSLESLSLTLELLKLNPELTLAWNYRREILLHNNSPLRDELTLLNSVMVDMRMTKSYCLWNHRRWVLLQESRNLSDDELRAEMSIVEKIHSLDSRNFHAWSFRKFLIDTFGRHIGTDDLEYSTQLIEADFSNYSAWFLRTTVDGLDPLGELEFVWNAIFTEPNDQSAWQYHDWLLEKFGTDLEMYEKDGEYLNELESVLELKDSKYVLLLKLKRGEGDEEGIKKQLCEIDPMRSGYYNRV